MATPLYPLRFQPLFRRYLWGGRRLETVLGKSLGQGHDFAESWELVDHGPDQSRVATGPLAGWTLRDLVREYGAQLVGSGPPADTRFPLLFKFLDAHRALSVQVHPNDSQAARLDPPDYGKTEAWVVLHADPGSCIYAGLRDGIGPEALQSALETGSLEDVLHQVRPRVGDCLLIEAGVVHALGAGLVIAEIQQSSDTTYRLFEWNRVGPDGRPRALHLEAGLAVVDFERGPVQPVKPEPSAELGTERLVACDKFVMNRRELEQLGHVGGDARFHILVVLAGRLGVERDRAAEPAVRGTTLLIPAACEPLALRPETPVTLLDIFLPATA